MLVLSYNAVSNVLHASVESHASMTPHPGWRRRLRCTWLRDVLKVIRLTAWEAWTAADDRKEWRAHRSTADYDNMFWWWRWWWLSFTISGPAGLGRLLPQTSFQSFQLFDAELQPWSNSGLYVYSMHILMRVDAVSWQTWSGVMPTWQILLSECQFQSSLTYTELSTALRGS